MFPSGFPRAAALAVPLILAASWAMAQQAITLAPGMVVVVTPSAQNGADPMRQQMERLFAGHQAMMARMMAGGDAPRPPSSLMGEMMDRMSGMSPGTRSGPTTRSGMAACQESIAITFSGQAGKPVVRVTRSGDGCGPVPLMAPVPVEIVPPAPPPPRSRLLEVNEPAPTVVEPRVRRRT